MFEPSCSKRIFFIILSVCLKFNFYRTQRFRQVVQLLSFLNSTQSGRFPKQVGRNRAKTKPTRKRGEKEQRIKMVKCQQVAGQNDSSMIISGGDFTVRQSRSSDRLISRKNAFTPFFRGVPAFGLCDGQRAASTAERTLVRWIRNGDPGSLTLFNRVGTFASPRKQCSGQRLDVAIAAVTR